MPCATPCDRLPCDLRYQLMLSCGCQCPSVCGEICPEGYCQKCSKRDEDVVDLVLDQKYNQIDLDQTPIVVLSCGHFFTTETLDGHPGLSDVYDVDANGKCTGLKEKPKKHMNLVPACPCCRSRIKQFTTHRYNRVVNQAVMDEMSRRFLTTSRRSVAEMDQCVVVLEDQLETSWKAILAVLRGEIIAKYAEAGKLLGKHSKLGSDLGGVVTRHFKNEHLQNAPVHMLHQAVVSAKRRTLPLTDHLAATSLTSPPIDKQISLSQQYIGLHLKCVIILDTTGVFRHATSQEDNRLKPDGSNVQDLCQQFFAQYTAFFVDCKSANLPKLAVEATLMFARVGQAFRGNCCMLGKDMNLGDKIRQQSIDMLQDASVLCQLRFRGHEELLKAVGTILAVLKDSMKELTAEELSMIKKAMLTGSGGMATHSGHWYNCENGHPVNKARVYLLGTTAKLIIVCNWRMWYADGAGSMSRVWCRHWWPEPYCCRWGYSSNGYGDVNYEMMHSMADDDEVYALTGAKF